MGYFCIGKRQDGSDVDGEAPASIIPRSAPVAPSVMLTRKNSARTPCLVVAPSAGF